MIAVREYTAESLSSSLSREERRAYQAYTRLVEGVASWQDKEYAYDPGMSWENFRLKNGVCDGYQ